MYAIIVTLLALIFAVLYVKTRKRNYDLVMYGIRSAAAADTRYAVLLRNHQKSEEGIHEICENYENEILTLNDKIEALENGRDIHLADLLDKEKLIEHHAVHCHGIVEDTVQLIMDRLRPIHPDEEPEGVPADG